MHKLLISLVTIASLGASSAGMATAKTVAAAPMTTTGAVKSVDAKLCVVTIKNMGIFLFGKKCNLSKIAAEEWVTITWTKSGNSRVATKIVAAKMLKLEDMVMSHMN